MKLLMITVILLFLSGCAISPINGAVNITKHPGVGSSGFVDNSVENVRRGTSVCTGILGIVAFGDCSIKEAMRVGDVKKARSIDHETINVLYFFSQYKTTVYGE